MNLHTRHAIQFRGDMFLTDLMTGETTSILKTRKSAFSHAFAGEKAVALLCENIVEVWDTKLETLLVC